MVKLKFSLDALRRPGAALLAALLLSATLAACAPDSPTLPPATAVGPKLPTATLEQAAPTVAPTQVEPTKPAARQAVTLTILHTNDVAGETDPCG
jgi:2',3'-cyclic-nucleotide 2'-phosphodiesterase (5'-nucleotidase family)